MAAQTVAIWKTDGPVPVLPAGQAHVMKNVATRFGLRARVVMTATSTLGTDVPICAKSNVALPATARDRKTARTDAAMAFYRPVNPVTITM